eukprot:TRINITY_DN17544_c0_g3_i1.p1 TRINITY_DN17544_c0_g3~~TRINITY_DN17544_c0_g3_i1.p1  ORF type:complete len:216 (-),score=28.79 TRINITY_DN17544_c0_g3_i1:172-819(-)
MRIEFLAILVGGRIVADIIGNSVTGYVPESRFIIQMRVHDLTAGSHSYYWNVSSLDGSAKLQLPSVQNYKEKLGPMTPPSGGPYEWRDCFIEVELPLNASGGHVTHVQNKLRVVASRKNYSAVTLLDLDLTYTQEDIVPFPYQKKLLKDDERQMLINHFSSRGKRLSEIDDSLIDAIVEEVFISKSIAAKGRLSKTLKSMVSKSSSTPESTMAEL